MKTKLYICHKCAGGSGPASARSLVGGPVSVSLQIGRLCRLSCDVLDPSGLINSISILPQDSPGFTSCLTVGLCFCLHLRLTKPLGRQLCSVPVSKDSRVLVLGVGSLIWYRSQVGAVIGWLNWKDFKKSVAKD